MKEILNKANPSNENFNLFREQMNYAEELFRKQVEGIEDFKELKDFIMVLIDNQDSDGYWKLIYSDDIPYDAIVAYWKYPTVLCTSMMINFYLKYQDQCKMIKGFHDSLNSALDVIERGKLSGHGFDSFNFRIKSLKTLALAGVMTFIEVYPNKHGGFNKLIEENKKYLEESLLNSKTKFDYAEEFQLRIKEVLNMMNDNKKVYLFVYGTLMRGNKQGETYLDCEEFICNSTLNGYSLYDLGYYPGIIEDKEGKVKGELYAISSEKLPQVDIYEAEGTLYIREKVKVYSDKGEPVEAYVYVYNQSVSGRSKIDYKFQPWHRGISSEEVEVLEFLRSQDHGVSIERTSNELSKPLINITAAIKNLVDLELINRARS